LRRAATGTPELEWKYFAAREQWSESFAAIKKSLQAGHRLKTQSDRLTVRLIFEKYLLSLSPSDEQPFTVALREYALLRSLAISLRAMGVQPDTSLLARLNGIHAVVSEDDWGEKLR